VSSNQRTSSTLSDIIVDSTIKTSIERGSRDIEMRNDETCGYFDLVHNHLVTIQNTLATTQHHSTLKKPENHGDEFYTSQYRSHFLQKM